MIRDMLQLNIQNETATLKAVILGTAKSLGAIPKPEDCYDPKSLQHVLKGTYPKEEDKMHASRISFILRHISTHA